MSTRLTKQQLLQRIAAIPVMERGKLSTYSFRERSGAGGPYYCGGPRSFVEAEIGR